MSLYYVKRVRIPRGPERLRGLYAGARPSYFHSASPTNRVACPTAVVTQLPPQIPGGNADPLVAGPPSAAGEGSVPLPCPFPEGNTESSTVTFESKIENLNATMNQSSCPSSSFARLPPFPPVNVPLSHSCNSAFICRHFSPDRTDSTPSKKVYSRCIAGALYTRAAKSSFGVSFMKPANLSSCDTYASIHASVLATNSAKNPGCTNSAPPPSIRHQDRTAHLPRVLRTIPGGSAESRAASSLPGTRPTETSCPNGAIEADSPRYLHHLQPLGTAISCVEISNSELLASSLPSLPSVQASIHSDPFASIPGCSSNGNTKKAQPQNTPVMPVFIAQNTLTQLNPNIPKPIENQNSKMSSPPCSSLPLLPPFPQLPPVNAPLFHSRKFASIRGCVYADGTRKNSSKKVHIWCIVGAAISFPVFDSRSLQRHAMAANAKHFKHRDLQLGISSSNNQFEPSKSMLKTSGTKWHRPPSSRHR
jgi:hypothetical protein